MVIDDAASRLPNSYRVVLELVAEGRAPEVIAERLGVELEAVPALVELAQAKLARLTGTELAPRCGP